MEIFIIASLKIDFYPWISYFGIVGLLRRIYQVLWKITFPLCLLEIFVLRSLDD